MKNRVLRNMAIILDTIQMVYLGASPAALRRAVGVLQGSLRFVLRTRLRRPSTHLAL